jgi:hypothetical protein
MGRLQPNVGEFRADEMERFSASERESLEQFATKFSIPLVHQIGKSDLLGTASVMFANGHHYLISAGHVLTDLREHPEDVGAPEGHQRASATTFGSGLHVMPIDDAKFDFGIFRIDSAQVVRSLERTWRFIVPDDLGLLNDSVERFAFAGYPVGRREFVSDQYGLLGRLTGTLPRYTRKSFEELNQELHSSTVPLDPAVDILLDYPDSFNDVEGKRIENLDVHGISGSPLWGVRPDPMNLVPSPEKRLQLVGIITSVREGDYIRAKRWTLIAEAFRQIDIAAGEEMRRCLSR